MSDIIREILMSKEARNNADIKKIAFSKSITMNPWAP